MKAFRYIFFLIIVWFVPHAGFSQLAPVPFIPGVSRVTDITHCGDERLFIVEQAGRIRISDLDGNLLTRPFLDIDPLVNSTGTEQGLLGLAFSPNYKTDGAFYINYINNQNNTVIARYRVSQDPDSADASSGEILFSVIQPFTNHNGGSLQFGPDGFLYISLGDGGAAGDPNNNGQNLQSLLGKILRIDVSGNTGYTIPASNPFVNDTAADGRIWAYGLRNAWRTSFDRITGEYWIADVGQNIREEINLQPSGSAGGLNYGWRCYEASLVYNSLSCLPASAYQFPLYEYPHGPACSITGGYVYRGTMHSEWFGTYLFTDYCSGEIQGMRPDSAGGYQRVSYGFYSPFNYTTFGEDVYGEVYLGSFYNGVFRLVGDTCPPVAFITFSDTLFSFDDGILLKALKGRGNSYRWYYNGSLIAGAVQSEYYAEKSGVYQVEVTNSFGCSAVSADVVVWLTRESPSVVVFTPGAGGEIYASSQSFQSAEVLTEIYSVSGQRIYHKKLSGSASGMLRLGTLSLANGVYVFRFEANGNQVITKYVQSGRQ